MKQEETEVKPKSSRKKAIKTEDREHPSGMEWSSYLPNGNTSERELIKEEEDPKPVPAKKRNTKSKAVAAKPVETGSDDAGVKRDEAEAKPKPARKHALKTEDTEQPTSTGWGGFGSLPDGSTSEREPINEEEDEKPVAAKKRKEKSKAAAAKAVGSSDLPNGETSERELLEEEEDEKPVPAKKRKGKAKAAAAKAEEPGPDDAVAPQKANVRTARAGKAAKAGAVPKSENEPDNAAPAPRRSSRRKA